MQKHYDVIIVGAGPAGSSCAKTLVENDIKTLVIEKKKLPREKSCCGIIVDNSIDFLMENYDIIPDSISSTNTVHQILISKDSHQFRNLPSNKIMNVDRRRFDYWLLENSRAEVIDDALYLNHKQIESNIVVNIRIKHELQIFKCKYLIGADGSYSAVKRKIDQNFNKQNFAISIQKVFIADSKIDRNSFYFINNKDYSDHFAWFGIKDEFLQFGTLVNDHKNINLYINRLTDLLKSQFDLKEKKHVKDEILLGDVRNDANKFLFGKNNVLLIGDSTGLVGAFGQGIPYALRSGKIAAESIIECQKDNLVKFYQSKIDQDRMNVIKSWRLYHVSF